MADLLIVEDDENMGLALKERLDADGHKVRLATDAVEGLAALRSKVPDVLLVDRRLPDKSGLEMLDEMKIDKAIDATKMAVTVLTNLDDPEVAKDMEERGYGYLVKADHSLDELSEYVKGQVS